MNYFWPNIRHHQLEEQHYTLNSKLNLFHEIQNQIKKLLKINYIKNKTTYDLAIFSKGLLSFTSLHAVVRVYHHMTYCIVLDCIVMYCIVLYSAVLYCIVLDCIAWYRTASYCIVWYCIAPYCVVLYYIVLYGTVLYCNVLYCIRLY